MLEMAYAALVSLAQTTNQILNHDRYSISVHEKQQIICIHEFVVFLQVFLENFPEKGNSLEGRIRELANEAEDIIKYLMLEQIRSGYDVESEYHPSGGKYECQLENVTEEIDSIAEEVMNIKDRLRINVDVQLGDESCVASSSTIVVPTHKHKDVMVGFDDDLLTMKYRLCGGEPSERQVIPIVGMGGIGKTTLARNTYNDPLIMERFQIRAWVIVSQNYSKQEILTGLLDSMKEFNPERFGKSNEENVYKTLKSRRYLIVMDDMWSIKVWDDVMNIFPDDHNGSRIILTTRLSDVAAYPNSRSSLHEMRFMDIDQSWNLLRKKVFTGKHICPPELEEIGKEIARSCRGLPLAIVVIAGLLSTVRKTPASWGQIAKTVNSVATKDEQIIKILSLSYTHLPHHLRPCFLYMGGFPEDYEIQVSKLFKLWIAEGFIEPSASQNFEEGAERYLEDLVKRRIVLVAKRKCNGKIKSCSIHDLVRDLCIRKAQEEKFLHVMDRSNLKVLQSSITNKRRVSITCSKLKFADIYGSNIRTIICFRRIDGSLEDFRLLRVLDVVNARIYSLPAQVFNLLHLRYLAFFCPMNIPAAISNLQNLQTIIIHSSTCLPLETWRMPQLRHLVSFLCVLPNPTGETFALENLQTLSLAKNFICSERNLKLIPNLKKLGVFYSGNEDYHLDNLVHLHHLEELKIVINAGFRGKTPAFPRTLKKLTLSGWQFHWNDMTLIGSLPSLQVLKLRDFACLGDEWETTEGEFDKLEFLLVDASSLQQWITESSHFPNLKCLVLLRCRYLSGIPYDIGEIPTLELIEVDDMNQSLVDSAKSIEQEQQSLGNDVLQVRVRRH